MSGYLIGSQEAGKLPLPPEAELQWWYQYYFATERGRAGYDKYRREFAKLIWRTASPRWNFDDATFERSAASFGMTSARLGSSRVRRTRAVGDPDAMTTIPSTQTTDGVPTYLRGGDPSARFADYYPAWIDRLTGDVTLEGSMLDGAVQGADAIRAIIGGVRELYDRQDFNFAGPWGDNGFIEDYTAEVRGRPLGCLSTWSPSTPTGRRSTSQPTTGR